MGQPRIIGVHGPLNGGKDTVANYIIAKFPGEYQRYAFAKPIKDACKTLFGFSQIQTEDRILKEQIDSFCGFSPRKAMQLMGTEYGREMLCKDIWIKRAELEARQNAILNISTIITDVRFQNEADWLRSQPNSLLIYLKVPNLVRDEKYNHASEAGINLIESDFVIINDKKLGINNLFREIDKIFESS